MLTKRTLFAAMAGLAILASTPAMALTESEIYKDFQGYALKGYDAVAYHLDRKPVKGTDQFMVEWKDAKWLFSSAENRDRFVAEPERWAPQYGGYCAWAIAKGRTAPINPKIFRIFDDKLYLNLNMKVHKEWLGKHEVFIANANEKWPAVLKLD